MNFESSILAAQTVSIEQFAPIRRYLPLALYVYAGTACTITSLTIQGIEQLPGAIAASNSWIDGQRRQGHPDCQQSNRRNPCVQGLFGGLRADLR